MLQKLGIKLLVWKLKGFFEEKKTYTAILAAAALALAILTDGDVEHAQALVAQGLEANASEVLTVGIATALVALKAGINREAAKQNEKLDALVAAAGEKK